MAGIPHVPFYSYKSGKNPPLSNSLLPGSNYENPPPPPPPPPGLNQTPCQPCVYNYGYSAPTPTAASNFGVPLTQSNYDPEPIRQGSNEKKTSDWTCDACDITLDSERALKSHRKSHVRCSHCPFEGAPKIVKGHFQAVHGKYSGSGFKTVTVAIPGCRVQRFKICVGNRPEDIQRWIAERKKRFPRQKCEEDSNTSAAKSTEKGEGGTGMSSLLAGYGSSSGSDDEETDTQNRKGIEEVNGDASKSTDPNPSDRQVGRDTAKSNHPPLEPRKSSAPCRYFMRNGTCLNGNACRFSHDVNNSLGHKQTRKRKRGSTSSDTLLRKLLENDVQREATLTIQLLEYIVERNFFDESTSRKQEE